MGTRVLKQTARKGCSFSDGLMSVKVNATSSTFEILKFLFHIVGVFVFDFFFLIFAVIRRKKNQCQHAGIFCSINKCTGSKGQNE